MKEAAGEANMTVITIVLISIVLGVGTVVVNSLMENSRRSSACTSTGGVWQTGECYDPSKCTLDANGKLNCVK
jgi:hypothetical protein